MRLEQLPGDRLGERRAQIVQVAVDGGRLGASLQAGGAPLLDHPGVDLAQLLVLEVGEVGPEPHERVLRRADVGLGPRLVDLIEERSEGVRLGLAPRRRRDRRRAPRRPARAAPPRAPATAPGHRPGPIRCALPAAILGVVGHDAGRLHAQQEALQPRVADLVRLGLAASRLRTRSWVMTACIGEPRKCEVSASPNVLRCTAMRKSVPILQTNRLDRTSFLSMLVYAKFTAVQARKPLITALSQVRILPGPPASQAMAGSNWAGHPAPIRHRFGLPERRELCEKRQYLTDDADPPAAAAADGIALRDRSGRRTTAISTGSWIGPARHRSGAVTIVSAAAASGAAASSGIGALARRAPLHANSRAGVVPRPSRSAARRPVIPSAGHVLPAL